MKQAALVLHRPLLFGQLSSAFLLFALPIYGKSMGASALEIGLLFAIFPLVLTLIRPLVGWATDRVGRRPFFVSALICYALSMVLFAVTGGMVQLYLAQMVRGAGSALLWITAYSIATDLSQQTERGEATGRVREAAAQGQFIGGVAGFVLISYLPPDTGWQIVFLGYAAMAATGAWLGWQQLPETAPERGQAAPETPGRHAISPGLLRLLAVACLTALSTSLIGPIFLIYIQDHFTEVVGELVLAIVPAAIIASVLPAKLGRLGDQIGRSRLLALGLLVAAIVSFSLPLLPGLLALATFWAINSAGWAMADPAERALVADFTGHRVRGTGYGLYSFANSSGATIGPLLGGWLYQTVGQAIPFYLNGTLLLVGAVAVLLLLKEAPLQAAEVTGGS